ncbi:MAG: transporter substrate-binding domain-containing protein [Gammaproteobacteria bacterium]|nr:transporter substrate-binding domain-containing protein [Gammaproteobacteria bacterium]
MTAVDVFPSRLEQILATGTLRVGTTGDYAPFSFSSDGEQFEGIDIELAHDLAESLDVRLELVHTTWPTLEKDLAAGRYDIAMSGVSRTLARQRHGYSSPPYHVGGKTPIVRWLVRIPRGFRVSRRSTTRRSGSSSIPAAPTTRSSTSASTAPR